MPRHANVAVSDDDDPGNSTRDLLKRARAGDTRALNSLFRAQALRLRGWARGRLPHWARNMGDTADLVQETLLKTFQRLDRFEDRGKGALQAYLRQAVANRIADHLRHVARHPTAELDENIHRVVTRMASPEDAAANAEWERKYKAALELLTQDEKTLVVGRLELGYSYEQLALITNRATLGATRMAARRAVIKLARLISTV
jgi:RNA polymerase sigma factor (sigma-70 family)